MKLPFAKHLILKIKRNLLFFAIKRHKGKYFITATILSSCVAACLFIGMSFLCFSINHENTNQTYDNELIFPQIVHIPVWTETQQEETAPLPEQNTDLKASEASMPEEPVIDPLSPSLDWSFAYDEISEEDLILLAQLIQGEAGSSGHCMGSFQSDR